MAVTLANRSDDDGQISLSTVSSKKRQNVSRTRKQLDKFFTERSLRMDAHFSGLDYIDLYGYPIDTKDLIEIDEAEAKEKKIGIFAIDDSLVKFVTPEPNEDVQSEVLDRFRKKGYEVKLYLCSQESFEKLIKTYEYTVSYKNIKDDIDIDEERVEKIAEDGVDLSVLGQMSKGVSVSSLLEMILVGSVQNNASDIHIEPEKNDCVLRFRLDGVLHPFARFSREIQEKIESRIKIISKLKLNVYNIPQDGRFSFKYKGKEIDVRVSMLPSNYGYSIVMRLLGTGSIALELDALGFVGEARKRVEREVVKPQGLILASGPTGSGKTTTLYTFLTHINTGESKIITLEDPVEYKLAGVSQTQIDKEGGYTFASGLRSILRQDPDAVMVGEIRDEETAQIAVEASLTGHKVLSTIHTNDAIGAVPRLMEMGLEGYLIASSLSLVIGQRLMRRLCPHCKREAALTKEQKEIVLDALETIPETANVELPYELVFYTSDGCPKCNNLGYKGRVGAYEVLTMTDGLRELLETKKPSFVEIRRVATKDGMLSMLQDGILKALDGVTDLDEVTRVVAS